MISNLNYHKPIGAFIEPNLEIVLVLVLLYVVVNLLYVEAYNESELD